MSSRARIFQIGFNKCGTTSLHRFFRDNGLDSVHWENGEIAEKFYARLNHDEDPFADYPDAVAFTDMIKVGGSLLEPYKSFGDIYRWYPDSFFILNTRNASDWIESRVRHGLIPRYRSALGLPDDTSVRRYWLQEWYRHHASVLEFFHAMPEKLLVYDIDRDAPAKLSRFLSPVWDLNPALFGRHNRTRGSWNSSPYRSVEIRSAMFEFSRGPGDQGGRAFLEFRPGAG